MGEPNAFSLHADLYITLAFCMLQFQVSFDCQGWESQLNPLCQPELNYTAPEHILSRTCSTSADLFSLGMLIYAVYNGGKPLCDCQGDIVTYKRHVEKVAIFRFQKADEIP